MCNCDHKTAQKIMHRLYDIVTTRDVEAVEYFCFRFRLLLKCHDSEFASASSLLLPLPAPDKVGRFRFQLILSKCFRFLQNFTASSFRFLCLLSNLYAHCPTQN